MVVGAHAVAAHGHVRATRDLDVWIRRDEANAKNALAALKAYGAPLHDLTQDDLVRPGTVFRSEIPPLRIDILTAIDGVEFVEAWKDRLEARFGEQPASMISLRHLIANKKACGRLQDLADIEKLEMGN